MVPLLLEEGFDVVGLDTDLYEKCTFGAWTQRVPFLKEDIRDVGLSSFHGCDAVVHLAALSNDPLGDLNPDLTYEINHLASVRIARLAKEAGVDIIPLALVGAYAINHKGSLIIRPGKMILRVGKPVLYQDIKALTTEVIAILTRRQISELLTP